MESDITNEQRKLRLALEMEFECSHTLTFSYFLYGEGVTFLELEARVGGWFLPVFIADALGSKDTI